MCSDEHDDDFNDFDFNKFHDLDHLSGNTMHVSVRPDRHLLDSARPELSTVRLQRSAAAALHALSAGVYILHPDKHNDHDHDHELRDDHDAPSNGRRLVSLAVAELPGWAVLLGCYLQ